MKNFILLFLFVNLFLAPNIGIGQVADSLENEPPMVWAEQMPEFPGGEEALIKYISENTKYPPLAAKKGIQGTVYVRFVVKKDGSIDKIEITRSVAPLLDKEAIRVVKSLPKFKPGTQDGKPVNVWFSVPFYFKLATQATDIKESEPILLQAYQMPEFPGGADSLRRYISENTNYPDIAANKGIQGTVYVRFVVKKDGSIGEVEITSGVDPLLDEEAIRVVKSLPKFKPGYQDGKPVNVWFSVPFYFKLTTQATDIKESEPILLQAYQMPEFPGGEVGLRTYISQHTDYPPLAKENGIQGTVYVRFVIKKDGSVGEVQVTIGVDPLLDEEAIRVVKSLPKFKPGIQDGKPVNVWFSVPISFTLNK